MTTPPPPHHTNPVTLSKITMISLIVRVMVVVPSHTFALSVPIVKPNAILVEILGISLLFARRERSPPIILLLKWKTGPHMIST